MNIQEKLHPAAKALLLNDETMGSVLLAIALDLYGTEVMEWEFQTLRMELADDYGIELSEINDAKLQALIVSLTTDGFYTDFIVFSSIANALSNKPVDYGDLEPTEPEDMAWAVFEVLSLDGTGHPKFTPEICRYVGVCLAEAGMHKAPKSLRFANYPDNHGPGTENLLTDDPALFNGFYTRNQEDAAAVDAHVQHRFSVMIDQLNEVPFRQGDADTWKRLIDTLSNRSK